MKLTLPYPISSNRYWETRVPKGWHRAVTYVSSAAKVYKREVHWIAQEAGLRDPSTRLIEIGAITLIPPATRLRRDSHGVQQEVKNGTALDLDNCLKVTFDALKGIAYVDDAQIKRIRGPIEYGEPEGKGGLVIEIEEYIPPAPPLFANVDEAIA